MSPLPTLETDRLRLRPFTQDDAAAYHVLVGDAEVMRHIPPGRALDPEEAARWIRAFVAHAERHGFGVWAVCDRATGELIGHGGLQRLPTGEVEVLYALVRSRWGRGLATEVARACLEHAFDTLALDRVVGLAEPGNPASRRVLEKCGMRCTGISDELFDTRLARYEIAPEGFVSSHGKRAPTGDR